MSYPNDQYPMVYMPYQQSQGQNSIPPQNFYPPSYYYGPPPNQSNSPKINQQSQQVLRYNDEDDNDNYNDNDNNDDDQDDDRLSHLSPKEENQSQQGFLINIYNLPTKETNRKNLRDLIVWMLEDENSPDYSADSMITSLQLYKSSGNDFCWSCVKLASYDCLLKLLTTLNGYSFNGCLLHAISPQVSPMIPPGAPGRPPFYFSPYGIPPQGPSSLTSSPVPVSAVPLRVGVVGKDDAEPAATAVLPAVPPNSGPAGTHAAQGSGQGAPPQGVAALPMTGAPEFYNVNMNALNFPPPPPAMMSFYPGAFYSPFSFYKSGSQGGPNSSARGGKRASSYTFGGGGAGSTRNSSFGSNTSNLGSPRQQQQQQQSNFQSGFNPRFQGSGGSASGSGGFNRQPVSSNTSFNYGSNPKFQHSRSHSLQPSSASSLQQQRFYMPYSSNYGPYSQQSTSQSQQHPSASHHYQGFRPPYQKILGNNYSSILNPDFEDESNNNNNESSAPGSPLQPRSKSYQNRVNYKYNNTSSSPYNSSNTTSSSLQQPPPPSTLPFRPNFYPQSNPIAQQSSMYDSPFDYTSSLRTLTPRDFGSRHGSGSHNNYNSYNNYHNHNSNSNPDSEDEDDFSSDSSVDDDEKTTEELMEYNKKRYVSPNQLFIGNIPFHSTYSSILSFMNSSGTIQLQQLKLKVQHNGISKGFAIGWTKSLDESTEIIKYFNGAKFEGRKLIVRFDKKPKLILKSHESKKRKNEEMMLQRHQQQQEQQAEAGFGTDTGTGTGNISNLKKDKMNSSSGSTIIENDDKTLKVRNNSENEIEDPELIKKEKEVARELINHISNMKAS